MNQNIVFPGMIVFALDLTIFVAVIVTLDVFNIDAISFIVVAAYVAVLIFGGGFVALM